MSDLEPMSCTEAKTAQERALVWGKEECEFAYDEFELKKLQTKSRELNVRDPSSEVVQGRQFSYLCRRWWFKGRVFLRKVRAGQTGGVSLDSETGAKLEGVTRSGPRKEPFGMWSCGPQGRDAFPKGSSSRGVQCGIMNPGRWNGKMALEFGQRSLPTASERVFFFVWCFKSNCRWCGPGGFLGLRRKSCMKMLLFPDWETQIMEAYGLCYGLNCVPPEFTCPNNL